MKKIININLNGRVIPIEDSAYEKLKAYIESLRQYFSKEEGHEEIINDIESRIAELMSEKIRLGAAAITDADVTEIVSSMGTVEDFEAEESENIAAASASSQQSNTSTSADYTYVKKEKGRLYRDSSDKMVGGVCAGIANYLSLDPAVVRILFAIITFGGFGLGILAYILLWIILPPKDLDGFSGKRLYRNPDDKIIGGVAGGLAAYFNRKASTIRLIFAAPIVLSMLIAILRDFSHYHDFGFALNIGFGSLSGTFILAYIVLWIVLPDANSEYQKMEMRGETVDINRIRQNVKEGMENMKGRMKEWGQEVKDSAQNLSGKAREFAGTRGKRFASETGEAARRTGRGVGHIIGVIFKAFFLFIAGSIAFALFVALIGLLIGGVGIWPLKNFILDGFWQNTYAWGTLILFLGVPLVGFIIWLLRRIMRVRSKSNYLGWTFGGLWTLGWVSVILLAASLFNDFRMGNANIDGQPLTITQPANGKMIVKVSGPEIEYSGSLPWIDIDGNGVDITRDTFKLANVRIRIEQSKDNNYSVEIKKYSRGRSVADAEDKAQKMIFNASYSDSVLDLGSGIAIDKETKFRGQQAIVIIRVPVGKKIRFDETINKLHAFNIHFNDHRHWRRNDRTFDIENDDYFDYRTDIDYTMNADGSLKDPTGIPVNQQDNNYRYHDENDPKTSTPVTDSAAKEEERIQQLEKLRKQREEDDRKIKELEQKQQKTNAVILPKMKKNNDASFAVGPSPVSSLVQYF